MSTRNITGMNPARRANAAVAESALARAEQLAAEARRIAQQRDLDVRNAEMTRRALEQEANDQLADIGEEVGQVTYIVNGDVEEPAPAAPEPSVEPPAQPEPARVNPPQEPPAQPEIPTAVLPEPQEAIGLPPAQEVPQHQFDPRGWNWLQWLLAIVLGIVGLFIGLRTVDWVVNGWNVGWPDGLIILLQVVFGLVWVVAFTGLGFFGGALLGFFVPRWRERRTARNDAVPPVPPANPPAA